MGWVSMDTVLHEARRAEADALGWRPPADLGARPDPPQVHRIRVRTLRASNGVGFVWRPVCSCGWVPRRRAFRLRTQAESSGRGHLREAS